MGPFRILSLDGGGSWALLQVMALQRIYTPQTRGEDVLADFDLVAANSGGSITLGGLLTNRTLEEILEFYLDETKRRMVFRPLPFELDRGDKPFRTIWNRFMQRIASVGAKYRTSDKLVGLNKLLEPAGERTLVELHDDLTARRGRAPHLLIIGFDYDRRRAKFFRSDRRSLAGSSHSGQSYGLLSEAAVERHRLSEPTLAEAIHASSNAPVTFFMSPAEFKGERYWDGAIGGYNNPVLAAVTETIANRTRYPGDEIHVLSLGTGTVGRPGAESGPSQHPALLNLQRQEPTLLGDLRQLAMAILDDPPDSATFIVHALLGQPLPDLTANPPVLPPVSGTVVRMSPVVRPVRDARQSPWRLPAGLSLEDFAAIQELELDAVDAKEVERLVLAGSLWLKDVLPNQPIRENKHYECQIGHATFSEALSAWRALASAGQAATAEAV